MKTFIYCALFLLASCSYKVEKASDDSAKKSLGSLSFAQLSAQVFSPKCARCHSGEWVGDYDATRALMTEISARIQSTDSSFMMPPPGAEPLTAGEKAAILDWISRGGPREAGEIAAPPSQPQLPPPPNPADPLIFATVKAKVLDAKCLRCHKTDFDTFEHTRPLLKDIEFRVQAIGMIDQMPPPRAPQLSPEELNLLLDWIRAGAPEN